MIHTIAHIFRKPDLQRAEFSAHYETHHTRLARKTLPEFSHYRRNHVLESTDDAQCPDSFSEFAYENEDRIQMTRAILGDSRGRELLADELKFMDKVRNRIYPVVPVPAVVDCAFPDKYVLLLRGAAEGAVHWLASWQKADPALQNRMIYSEAGAEDPTQQLHWLMGWSQQAMPLTELQEQLVQQQVPVLWCARVMERNGYPE
jgi:hypothetical protein